MINVKLYNVNGLDSGLYEFNFLIVAKNELEAKNKAEIIQDGDIMTLNASVIDIIDGYKVTLVKEEE